MRISTDMMESLLCECEYFASADIETTGFMKTKGAEIIEIGVVVVDVKKRKIVKRYESLVRPRNARISSKITEITGISNEMVESVPYIEQVLREFMDVVGDLPIVVHNGIFDWDRFLEPSLKEIGIVPKNHIIDTLEIARRRLRDCPKKSLGEICKYFGVTMENAHRALVDSKYTSAVALKLREILMKISIEATHIPEMPTHQIPTMKIIDTKFWEKKVGNREIKRIYLSSNLGTFFYDIRNQEWYAKALNYNCTVDLKSVERHYLEWVKMPNMNAVIEFYKRRAC